MENIRLKDYLLANGMSKKEWHEQIAENLKEVINIAHENINIIY
jgi:hypothetical protein